MSGKNKQTKTFICIDCGKYVKPLRKQRCNTCYRKWNMREAPKRKCICDPRCQIMIPSIRYDGKPNYYAKMHNTRGGNHYNWKGGIQESGEYLVIHTPYHPNKRQRNTIPHHRWVYEQHYNCCLLRYTEIDHINGDKRDNRIENLRPLYKAQHTSRHHKGKSKKQL